MSRLSLRRSSVAAIEEGRAVFANIRSFLTSNVTELIPYLAFVVFRIPLPLTIIQILAVDLGTDMLPALGLGAEKPAPDIMRTPPRSRADRLLNWPLLARAYLFLGVMQAAAAMSAYWFVLRLRHPAFSFSFFSNKLILAGIATEIALIDYTPWGNALFGTAPIPPAVWLFIIPFALGMLVLEELRKWFVRFLFPNPI